MSWQYNLFPHLPEEFGWLSDFNILLEINVPESKWTFILHHLVMLGVKPPAECTCEGRELSDWSHLNHGAYNAAVRNIIQDHGARRGLKKALDRDISGPVDEFGYGRIARRDYALQLRDFLSKKPKLAWF